MGRTKSAVATTAFLRQAPDRRPRRARRPEHSEVIGMERGTMDQAEYGWSVAGIIRRHARERGHRPMLTYGDRVVTYAEIDARSNQVARALAAEGVRAQD